ncbi:hypothetical protein M406DRAFT_97309 [Cryphonectria parasitica EP155]|uniref:Uncharacterized protein n=1 Tax=Cryphonectria parasitica (strain ATCC 38755 / EP155) TaxID=660469 RepID=A0A9P4Y341_CRYP1|nr:uncharacterized protein M406DRAFT_97309 [Cryphonectria parasitica EP155]KAF3765671.1 hypothetical protein M406DRAFT_97309 [Cryphonectria parasitica EP155]
MRQLCIAISAQALPSIERFGFAIIPSLYEGYGAQIVEGDLLSETNASTANTSIPPPYNNTVTNTTSLYPKSPSSWIMQL